MINWKETIMAEKECEDYIERKTAFLWLRKYYPQDKLFIGSIIAAIPKADMQEIKHGKWEEIRDAYGQLEGWIHIECGREVKIKENYCPHCGARMDWRGEE